MPEFYPDASSLLSWSLHLLYTVYPCFLHCPFSFPPPSFFSGFPPFISCPPPPVTSADIPWGRGGGIFQFMLQPGLPISTNVGNSWSKLLTFFDTCATIYWWKWLFAYCYISLHYLVQLQNYSILCLSFFYESIKVICGYSCTCDHSD
jgi:hypothetical protein